MKKLLLTLLLFGAFSALWAQKKPNPYRESFRPEHEVRLGAGAGPMTRNMEFFANRFCDYYDTPGKTESLDNIFHEGTLVLGAMKYSGSINAGYTYKPLFRLEVGGTVSYVGFFRNIHSVSDDSRTGYSRIHHIGLTGTGQVTLLGLSFGNRVSGYVELISHGIQGTLHGGIGYRWNIKNNVL